MIKKIRNLIIAPVVVVGVYFAWQKILYEHYPAAVEPSESWAPYINALDTQRESFFVEAHDGVKLEADLFIPNGGATQKPAVVFSPGSGDALYQNYSYGLIETYILDVFLSHDFAVLLVNKRGMGQSEGNYVKNSIEGRAEDIWAAVQSIQNHPQIVAEDIGLIGHSQGGWVVTQAAADQPEIAFFISLAGPTMSMRENALDNEYHYQRCQGTEGEALDEAFAKRDKMIDLSIKIGNLTNFGFFGFDARNMNYDPRNALKTTQSPGLFVYAENDDQVTPAPNIDRMNEIFDNKVPQHFNVVLIEGATHAFRLVNDPCESWVNVEDQEKTAQLIAVLNDWLTKEGY